MIKESIFYFTGELCFVTLEIKEGKIHITSSRNGNTAHDRPKDADSEINDIILIATKMATEIVLNEKKAKNRR